MNRDILFRGKRLDNGEWIQGFYFELSYNGINAPCIGIEPLAANDYGEIYDSCYEMIDSSTVVQYIPILDAFVGDILYGEETDNYGTLLSRWTGTIKYNDEKGRYMIEDDIGDWYEIDDSQFNEVIGNIHDGKVRTRNKKLSITAPPE